MTSPSTPEDYDVLVVGGGPTGLTLAIDLGQRGVRTLLVEQSASASPWPKFDRCNARTMESYRRLGIADGIRGLGYPADHPMDVYVVESLAGPTRVRLEYPSVAQMRDRIDVCEDGSQPLEPYQLVSQNRTEPFLRGVAEGLDSVAVRFGTELAAFTEYEDGIRATTRSASGDRTVTARFVAGCDGARSTVRKQLDISLAGEGRTELRQVIFRSDELADRIPVGRGRHYVFLDRDHSGIVMQGDRREFTLRSSLPADTNFRPVLERLIGFDVSFEITHVAQWTPRLLMADEFARGRAFLAGDAAHQVIPTGGLGMNTGVGDALNLSWKLAAVTRGWGGDALLASYQAERKPVAERNREASSWAAAGVGAWHAAFDRVGTVDDALVAEIRAGQSRMYSMVGAELGYTYAESPAIAHEPGGSGTWDLCTYTPRARPGDRLPHCWADGHRAVQDLAGHDFTLLDLASGVETASLVTAFAGAGVPLRTVSLPGRLRTVYGAGLLMVRPDLHVAWRGDQIPPDPGRLVALVAGRGPVSGSSGGRAVA